MFFYHFYIIRTHELILLIYLHYLIFSVFNIFVYYNREYIVMYSSLGYDSEVEIDNSVLYKMQIQNNKKKTLIKQNKLNMKPESELEIVQTKILEYLAQLDMTTCLRLLGDPNKITSYPVNIINYNLPFNDCKINISFGE